MSKGVVAVLTLLVSSIGLAHSGYNLVFQENLNTFKVTAFEDSHLIDGKLHLSLFMQVTENGEAPKEAPELELSLQHNQTLVFSKQARALGPSSDDGKTIYEAYVLESSLPQTGNYAGTLTLKTTHESFSQSFALNAEPKPEFRFIELMPSLIPIAIVLGGLALIFLNPQIVKRKDLPHAQQSYLNHS